MAILPGFPRTPLSTALVWIVAVALLPVACSGLARADDETAAIEKRLADSARYLSSDELEGRGIGTKGLDLAADYIARQFAELGLKTDLFDGQPMQKFSLPAAAEIGPNNKLLLVGPPAEDGHQGESIELKLSEDFTPVFASGSQEFDLPLVFVGYGITGKDEGYDDYAGLDVKGKMVVVLRHEPQQDDPDSVFAGKKNSQHAPLQRKISNAFEHEAAGVIFCTDRLEVDKTVATCRKAWQKALDRLTAEHEKLKQVESPTAEQIEAQRKKIGELILAVQSSSEKLQRAYDPVMAFTSRGRETRRDFPVIHCRRGPLDRMIAAVLDTSLAELEQQIDRGPTPHSRELSGWRAVGRTDVQREQKEVKNVVGVLEGEGPLAEETVVIGAHYDHLGVRQRGLLSRLFISPEEQEIYNGADDNASGVAALIEIARSLSGRQQKLRRRVVFIAFTAEERGLLGSAHYVNHPLIPLEDTVGMLNLDMVGRLRDDKLTISGTGTAEQFDQLLDESNQPHGLKLNKRSGGFGGSDHMPFQRKKIPAMHFITGTHADLHRPSDTFEKLNVEGMRRVTALVTDVAVALADAPGRPEYVATKTSARPRRDGQQSNRPYLGTIPDFSAKGPGFAISGVTEGGPAEKAGMREGDAIIRFGESKIGGIEDIDGALRKHKPGDRVKVLVRRGDKEMTFEVTLEKRP